jgi:diamine N-acetyltransferase
MLLEDDTIKLRALEPQDLEILYDWENNTEIWEVGNNLVPYSKYILHEYIENSHRDLPESKQLRLIIELKTIIPHMPIGTIDLFDIDFYNKNAGIGILIADKQNRNKGYASKTLKLIEEYAFRKLALYQLYCRIDVDNEVSLKVFQNIGYTIIGKISGWKWSSTGMKDVYFLQHILK